MDTKIRLGLRLQALRKSKKLTQDELATKLGRSVDAISNIERGKSLPNFETIELLCKVLDVPLKTFFDFDRAPMSAQKARLLEELQVIAQGLPTSDLEVAIEQIKALSRRGSKAVR